ncbi:hypothetical protein B566_EDAN013332 [Ephemera danica]|nr:hypothetical protein B566_EDAN013332 [Ephemera danica]
MDSKALLLLLSLVQFVHVSYQLPTPAVKDATTNGADAQRNAISEAMRDFALYTCIKFVPHTNQPNHVRIIKSGTGCWSYVGRIAQWSFQQLSLDDGCVRDKYVAIHELNHAVAETSSLNKDYWMDAFGVGYDCYSAMHYGPVSFASNGQPTLICKASPNRPVGSGQGGLSGKDIEKIRRMYKCNGSVAGV